MLIETLGLSTALLLFWAYFIFMSTRSLKISIPNSFILVLHLPHEYFFLLFHLYILSCYNMWCLIPNPPFFMIFKTTDFALASLTHFILPNELCTDSCASYRFCSQPSEFHSHVFTWKDLHISPCSNPPQSPKSSYVYERSFPLLVQWDKLLSLFLWLFW